MQAFKSLTAHVLPLLERDINTDQILPGRFMHMPRENYGQYFFHDLRFDAEGRANPEFVINDAAHAGAQILLCGRNFGCGSSREHAVYTLADYGIRAILAPSFGDIFYINCFKNGVLPIVVPEEWVQAFAERVTLHPRLSVFIDLPSQQVLVDGMPPLPFQINAFYKRCLIEGLDEIDLTLSLHGLLDRFEQAHAPSAYIPEN